MMNFRKRIVLVIAFCLIAVGLLSLLRNESKPLVSLGSLKRYHIGETERLFENLWRETLHVFHSDKQSRNVTPSPCKPVNDILFLKTHKTGSSTVTNILNRYGDTRSLVFALPASQKSYSLHWPHPFTQGAVARAYWKAPNILCNHARYNRVPMNKLFPKETTRYITLLREPTRHFESIFNFFHLKKHFKELRNVSYPLEKFLQNATSYLGQLQDEEKHITSFFNLIKNPALFELGLDTKYHANLTVVKNYIRFLQKEFDLVMLMEYFDESLVLLKRRFCWKMEDILYFKLNERRNHQKQSLSGKAQEQIQKWNLGDVLLYDAFHQTLWKMIKEEGPDFFNDLAFFRKELASIKNACLQEGNFLTKPYAGRLVQGYAVKSNISKELHETCNKMIMNEIPYLDYHRQRINKQLQVIVDKFVYEQDLLK
ncbi:galactosylceramide sulfotransferase-like isoform X1 [Oculina patagonica]